MTETTPEPKGRRRVTIIRDHMLKMPELWMDIHILGDAYEEKQFANLFVKSRCRRADSLEKADIVVFTGGPDVDPMFYGETPHPKTYCNPDRDAADMDAYLTCLDQGIPMVGVCRGAQFLHVMQGGKLYQDVDNHTGNHAMYDLHNKEHISCVSSVHHQMVIENKAKGMEIVAHTVGQSKKRALNATQTDEGTIQDIEAFFYRDACIFGVQGHPEYTGYNQFSQWFMRMIEEFIVLNNDLMYNTKGVRRLATVLANNSSKDKEEALEEDTLEHVVI